MRILAAVLAAAAASVNGFVWGPAMTGLLLGTGMLLSFRAGFPQVRRFGEMLRYTFGSAFSCKKADGGAVTPFQAVSTALAGTIGTGNIAGVAGAIALGGPGAVFWMWVSAFWGMATKYTEVLLAVRFRQRDSGGEWVGGTMYTIQNGLGRRFRPLAVLFSVFGMLAAFGIGNLSQVNTIASAVSSLALSAAPGQFSPRTLRLLIGLLTAITAAAVTLGGAGRIGAAAERLVPAMCLLYTAGALTVIVSHFSVLPAVFASILRAAFHPQAIVGASAGIGMQQAARFGVERGIFSNEAGLGSAPMAHASTSETDASRQALLGIFEVFMDTIVICSLTALAILSSGTSVSYGRSAGAELTVAAFSVSFGGRIAGIIIAVCIVFFAFSSILSWSLYGCRCVEYLFGNNCVFVYRAVFLAAIVPGALIGLSAVWAVSDALNGLMAIPNLLSLLALSGVAARESRYGPATGQ